MGRNNESLFLSRPMQQCHLRIPTRKQSMNVTEMHASVVALAVSLPFNAEKMCIWYI